MIPTSQSFKDLARGAVRPVSYDARVSFRKEYDDSITFFVLDSSLLDGGDLLGNVTDDPLQEWDKYEYDSVTDRVYSMEVARTLDFPYSVSAATAQLVLNNYDRIFTPNSSSTLSQYILPSRPLRLFMGFNNENLQQFVGLTEYVPEVDDSTALVTFRASDFLTIVLQKQIPNILVMTNVTTDEVLDALFQSVGLLPGQYNLPKGSNLIKFVYYPAGKNMGDIVRDLIQAELGKLWLDENGVIQFRPRTSSNETALMTVDLSNIISIKNVSVDRVINKVSINATIREVQAKQPFPRQETSTDDWLIEAGQSKDFFIRLDNPTTSVTTPTIGKKNDSYFTAINASSGAVSSATVVSDFLFTDTYKVTFSNPNSYKIRISDLVLWGTPATIVDEITYIDKRDDSIEKYGERLFEITNDFVQSISACESIASMLLESYSEYGGEIEIDIKGTPALQQGDRITIPDVFTHSPILDEMGNPILDENGEIILDDELASISSYSGEYNIVGIIPKIISGAFEQTITARRASDKDFFVLDVSLLNGNHVLSP